MSHKKAILDKYADFLRHKYEAKGWTIDVVSRTSNGTSGVWGIIHLTKEGKEPVILRVHPWRGIDKVKYKGQRYFKEKVIMSRKQVQYKFGYAPVPRTSRGMPSEAAGDTN